MNLQKQWFLKTVTLVLIAAALSVCPACMQVLSRQRQALHGRAELSSLRRTKFDAILDLPLKLICHSSVSLKVGCVDLTEAEVKHNIKSIMMEISLRSPLPGGILFMTRYLKRLLP